jgi:hypothetical protein
MVCFVESALSAVIAVIASGAIHFRKEHALDQKIAVDSIHLCSVTVPPFYLSQICSALSQKTR